MHENFTPEIVITHGYASLLSLLHVNIPSMSDVSENIKRMSLNAFNIL